MNPIFFHSGKSNGQKGIFLPHDPPLKQQVLCNTDDLDELNKHIGNVLIPNNLRVPRAAKSPVKAQFHHAALSEISVNYLLYGQEATVNIDQLGFFLIEIPLSGSSKTQYGNHHIITAPDMGVVAGPYKEFSTEWNQDCSKLLIKINRLALEKYLSDMLGADLTNPLDFELGIDFQSPANLSLRNLIQWLVAEFENTHSLLNKAPLASSQYEQMLMWALLNSQPNNYSQQLNAVTPPATPHYVHTVEDYIHTYCAEAITLSKLVEISGVSGRSLLEGFKRHKGTSPMKYLKSVRMERVYEELKKTDPSKRTVTEIALAWGFTQLGKFSGNYKQRFGESPSDTLKK